MLWKLFHCSGDGGLRGIIPDQRRSYISTSGNPSVDDGTLITQITARDEAALSRLYDRYHAFVYSLAVRITGDTQEAEAVVLEVFLQVWQRASDYQKDRGKVSTWLITIARSRAIDHRRRSIRRSQVIQSVEEDPELVDRVPATDEDAFQLEHRRQVRQILNELPESQRKALELAYFEGMSQSEIAEALGEPLGTVKTRIRSAMATLRAALVSYK